MVSQRVYAKDVRNLTDARYFAAWGVEWLGYKFADRNNKEEDLHRFSEIQSWVEGPKFIAEFNPGVERDFVRYVVTHAEVSGIYLEDPADFHPEDYEEHHEIILGSAQMLQTGCWHIIKFPQTPPTDEPSNYKFLMDMSDCAEIPPKEELSSLPGLVLEGGEEELIGVKSFDQLDGWFESME